MKDRALLVLSFAVLLPSCTGWFRVSGGNGYSTDKGLAHTGPVLATDQLFSPAPHSPLNRSSTLLPFAMHNQLELLAAPDLKSFSWGTGIAYRGVARPIAGYAIAGTNLHVDLVDQRKSFGNFQPYAEAGVAAPIGGQREEEENGFIVTLGIEWMYFIHYAWPVARSTTDDILTLKFGIAWEKNH